MSKFIVLNEYLNLTNKEKWYKKQEHKINLIFSNLIPINKYLIKDTCLMRKALLEISDDDLKLFIGLNYTVYNTKEEIPILVSVPEIWDEFNNEEKINFLTSENSIVLRFKFEMQIRTFFNINNQSFRNALNQLQNLNVLQEGKTQYILDKYGI